MSKTAKQFRAKLKEIHKEGLPFTRENKKAWKRLGKKMDNIAATIKKIRRSIEDLMNP